MDGQIPQKTPGQKRWVHKGMGGYARGPWEPLGRAFGQGTG